MEYAFRRLPPEIQEQLVAVGRGAHLPGHDSAPLPGSGRLVALAVVGCGAALLLLGRVATQLDPFGAGTVFFHGALAVPFAAAGCLAVAAVLRRAVSPLKPAVVVTPTLLVETGVVGDPVHVRRLDQVVFERNEPDWLILRFNDGEVALPRLGEREAAVTAALRGKLADLRKRPKGAPVDDEWARALAEVQTGGVGRLTGFFVAIAVVGVLGGALAWGVAWCRSFAKREREAWTATEAERTAHGYTAYLDFARRARRDVPTPVRSTTPIVEHAELAATREEELAFEESRAAGTAEALAKYLARFKDAPHAAEARALHDERSFAEAKATRSGRLLRAYLAAHPGGPHAKEARALLDLLCAETEKLYRDRGKEWLAALVGTMQSSESGVVPTIVDSSYERDGQVGDALEKCFAKSPAGAILTLSRAPSETSPPRLVVKHSLVATGGVYLDNMDHLAAELGVTLPRDGSMGRSSATPVKSLVLDLAVEIPGGKPLGRRVLVAPPDSLSVATRDFLRAHPHEVENAMMKALYEELERQLAIELDVR